MKAPNRTYKFHPANTIPKGDWVWVFGSDESGKHRSGSAKVAHVSFGAKYGFGVGLTGKAYAVPVKDKHLRPLEFNQIEPAIRKFLKFANENPKIDFYISENGFDISSHAQEIADLFAAVPQNCSLPEAWRSNVLTKF